ncbi:hypothetical protein Misp05_40950 [Micromonospora sp. NBRC 107095]|nr:hypothetical protein Misp05_40950 [Micromonospora sp. NBRC 107095]
MGDGVEGRQVGAVEQQLPGERRAVECPGVENCHRIPSVDLIVRPGVTVPGAPPARGRRCARGGYRGDPGRGGSVEVDILPGDAKKFCALPTTERLLVRWLRHSAGRRHAEG